MSLHSCLSDSEPLSKKNKIGGTHDRNFKTYSLSHTFHYCLDGNHISFKVGFVDFCLKELTEKTHTGKLWVFE